MPPLAPVRDPTRFKRSFSKSRLLLLTAVLWIGLALVYLLSNLRVAEDHILSEFSSLPPSPTSSKPFTPVLKAPEAPGISFVVIWENKSGPEAKPYFSNFIQSFRGANRDYVELVWIGLRQYDEDRCLDPTEGLSTEGGAMSNVKLVCMDRMEYWKLHRRYFCAPQRWDCTPEQAESVLQKMIDRHDDDWYKSYFRIYRGYVFKQFMHPGVKWWAWADQDTFMGDFRTQFPWEASAYDVLIPTLPDDALLYIRGHLAFFRADAETEYKLSQYPDLLTPDSYLRMPTPEFAAMEESEYSAFIFRNPSISFLTLPFALVDVPLHLNSPSTFKISTLSGTYSLSILSHASVPPIGQLPVLSLPTVAEKSFAPSVRVFSEKGITRPVDLQFGSWEEEMWFPSQFTTHYKQFHPILEGWRRIVGRGGGYTGGAQGVWERLEPPRQGLKVRGVNDDQFEMTLSEGLYVHWFEEKWNAPWLKDLARRPIFDGQALVTAERYGAEVWDVVNGTVIWKGAGSSE